MLRICCRTAKQQETVCMMCVFVERSEANGYPDFEQTGRAEQGPSLLSMVHAVSDGCRRDDAHHIIINHKL